MTEKITTRPKNHFGWEKEFNFKQEIRKIPINSRERQIIKVVEEEFDKFIKLLKKKNTITHQITVDDVDKLAGDLK